MLTLAGAASGRVGDEAGGRGGRAEQAVGVVDLVTAALEGLLREEVMAGGVGGDEGAVDGGAAGGGEAFFEGGADGLAGQVEHGVGDAVAEVVPGSAGGPQAAQEPACGDGLARVAQPVGGAVVAQMGLVDDGGEQGQGAEGGAAAAGVAEQQSGEVKRLEDGKDDARDVGRPNGIAGLAVNFGQRQRRLAEADAADRASYNAHGVNSGAAGGYSPVNA
jgi:hypothetical protein